MTIYDLGRAHQKKNWRAGNLPPRVNRQIPFVNPASGAAFLSLRVLAAVEAFCNARPMKQYVLMGALLVGLQLPAAELRFRFADAEVGQLPAGFTNLLAGTGQPGQWQVRLDEVPSLLAPLTPQAPNIAKQPVLAQVSTDTTDERFPLLVFEKETFGDFTLRTRIKMVGGEVEQMAGIAFRLRDAENFYVIRASALGQNVRFYKFVDGGRSAPIGPEVKIKPGQWHELMIRCEGTQIRCELDGQLVLPPLNDQSFRSGRIGFFTKSDSVSYFADTVIEYTPQLPLAQRVVDEVLKTSSRLLDLKLAVAGDGTNEVQFAASKDPQDVGTAAGQYEAECLRSGQIFFSKNSSHAAVVMPVRDRNGEIIAAARIHMTTFLGQTERNAVARAMPIIKQIQALVAASSDPLK